MTDKILTKKDVEEFIKNVKIERESEKHDCEYEVSKKAMNISYKFYI